jgi:hypothetical protein
MTAMAQASLSSPSKSTPPPPGAHYLTPPGPPRFVTLVTTASGFEFRALTPAIKAPTHAPVVLSRDRP